MTTSKLIKHTKLFARKKAKRDNCDNRTINSTQIFFSFTFLFLFSTEFGYNSRSLPLFDEIYVKGHRRLHCLMTPTSSLELLNCHTMPRVSYGGFSGIHVRKNRSTYLSGRRREITYASIIL